MVEFSNQNYCRQLQEVEKKRDMAQHRKITKFVYSCSLSGNLLLPGICYNDRGQVIVQELPSARSTLQTIT